tara:strand:+ start:39487 stop:40443 length:957 start_codon:yes stop_codon:yes gene_type:complete
MSGFPYLTQAVRDLAWTCFSPGLLHSWQLADEGQNVTDCGLFLTPARRRWLAQLDNEPRVLLEALTQKPVKRLGLYFEQLWHFFLEQDPDTTLIAHNLAVRDQGRTLGEFDVIYWCHSRQRHFHLELAVKFYLGWRQHTSFELASQWREWLGPSSQDRLDLKLEQLLRRQIRLSAQPQARELLAELGVGTPAREIAIKGYLFQSLIDPLPPPFGYNPQCPLQHWIPVDKLATQLPELQTDRYLLLAKLRWLSPAQATDEDEILNRTELVERLQSLLASNPRSRLVAGVSAAGLELCRFFVTPGDWPAGAKVDHLKEKT